jgi:FkbM family methyltransferase
MSLSVFARTLIENATRNWVYTRRLPSSFGSVRIFVTPSAGLKYLFKSMTKADPVLLRNVIELIRPNDIVWDIGSNVGLFAFAAAARAGRNGTVIAFEPDVYLVQILRKSALAQPGTSAPVRIIPAAVASKVSLQHFMVMPRARALNAMAGYGYAEAGNKLEQHTVVALNLDWLAEELPPPNVIKCDVEGAEAEVFSGQSKILKDIRPVIICEVGQATSDRITEILVNERYHLFDGEKPLSPSSEVDRAPWTTIAIPFERRQMYTGASRATK